MYNRQSHEKEEVLKRNFQKFMNFDALSSPSASPEVISSVTEAAMTNLSEDSFAQFMSNALDAKINFDVFSKLLLSLAESLSKINDLTLQLSCLRKIVSTIESRKVSDRKYGILEIFAQSLIDNHFYFDAAKILEQFPAPEGESDADILEYYLKIGECYLNDGYTDKAFQYLQKMSSHVFQLSTPPPLLNRFDQLRGTLHISRGSFLDAAYAFTRLWNTAKTTDLKLTGLRNATVCAILAPASKNRSLLLHRFTEDENITSLAEYSILEYIVKGKFIDKMARDEFRSKIVDIVPDVASEADGASGSAIRALEAFSTQHNISVAQKMFKSIEIGRLARLVGDTPARVEEQLRRMIADGSMRAAIDQPTNTVEFEHEETRVVKDRNIGDFCQCTSETAAKLAALL
ncbi:hypothetical protein TRFO_26519 [Tritrichomonas foetus]|uniref:COP9 signalosome complex subunit 4 n=1 Tax=Tritrichomonas foetus TaxID=1144522 RepID=A0A1J4K2M0_9EUKA|nr:hypothetical protein TRFO_26519 [Tritrichomonas foetus]|eukprot:OHT05639.1 hypothetical protein TRFO_26519 [Tritrichomonas foetus]